MQIITKGKNIRLTDSMRALAHEKLARLPRYGQEISLAEVEFSVETAKSVVDREIVEVTMEVNGQVLRADARAGDVGVALDAVVDKLVAQLADMRSRERAHVRGRTPAERFVIAEEGPTGGDYSPVIPPSPEESETRRARRHPGAG
ncbi:MAG: hypothetical protein KatS3mg059_0783 [Thermomicrobiales bacterium]|nr:MAG: hypothetical protein KatS3mg059_0783 [Thermomicrobiales bacterium]